MLASDVKNEPNQAKIGYAAHSGYFYPSSVINGAPKAALEIRMILTTHPTSVRLVVVLSPRVARTLSKVCPSVSIAVACAGLSLVPTPAVFDCSGGCPFPAQGLSVVCSLSGAVGASWFAGYHP